MAYAFVVATEDIPLSSDYSGPNRSSNPELGSTIRRGHVWEIALSLWGGRNLTGGGERNCAVFYGTNMIPLSKESWRYLHELESKEFEELGLLGEGAFGQVMNIRYGKTDFAKKVVKAKEFNMSEWEKYQAFEDEINLSPHFVRFITTWRIDHHYAILMLPKADKDLKAHLKLRAGHEAMDAAFSPYTTEILRWINCLSRTLSAMHRSSAHRLHGDIKPANILIHGSIILYTDYGVAAARKDTVKSGFTNTGSSSAWSPVEPSASDSECRCGCNARVEEILDHEGSKPAFLPGENENQLTELGGQKGDVFSLGWVIYEMLLATTPDALQRLRLPCRPKAKQFAWRNMDAFVNLVKEICDSRINMSCSFGQEHEKYASLTKDLLESCDRPDDRPQRKRSCRFTCCGVTYHRDTGSSWHYTKCMLQQ